MKTRKLLNFTKRLLTVGAALSIPITVFLMPYHESNSLLFLFADKLPFKDNPPCESYHEKNKLVITENQNNENNNSTKILVGIPTTAKKKERRELLRKIYLKQKNDILKPNSIDFKFILGKSPLSDKEEKKIELEIAAYNDIVMLDVPENLNNGKTFDYFAWVVNNFQGKYDFISKADDDIYLNFFNLMENIKPLPRSNVYYGPYSYESDYITGMFYLMSFDNAKIIGNSKNKIGAEDLLVSRALRSSNDKHKVYPEQCLFYEDPRTWANRWPRFLYAFPQTIGIHGLKKDWQWEEVIDKFVVNKPLNSNKSEEMVINSYN